MSLWSGLTGTITGGSGAYLRGSGFPADSLGTDGDIYYDIATGLSYIKSAPVVTSTGVVGRDGLTIRGSDGEDGDQGPPGPPGISVVGPQGPAGSPGLQTMIIGNGDDGDDGAMGPPGTPGAQGLQGPSGSPGLQTIIIGNGDDGEDGPMGPPGAPGAQGLQGLQGPAGSPGLQTMIIGNGDDGDDGAMGPPGLAGAAGAQGIQGVAGAAGIPGMPGNDGDDGADGRGVTTPPQGGIKLALPASTGTVSMETTAADIFTVTPTGAITLNASQAGPVGRIVRLIVLTSGVTSFNVTPTTNFKTQGALATGTVTAKTFVISFVSDGTNLVEISRTTAM